MADFQGFPTELFSFLKDLGKNNNRDWFNSNKERYERYLKEPTLSFIGAMGERLPEISSSYLADTRVNGGSMFRIYRDTRFSKDKTPYKTNIGCQFRHSAGKDAHAPGFYMHIEPGESFAGGGIWRPPTAVLAKIRDAIDEKQDEWRKIKEFVGKSPGTTMMDAERYKRPPRGFDADHPLIDDIKLKSFFAGRSFTEKEVTSPDYLGKIMETFHNIAPLMRFINEALSLSF